MIPYARLAPGPGFRPARAAGYYLQRAVTHPALRRRVAGFLGGLIGARPLPLASGSDSLLRELEIKGFARIENLLSEAEASDVVAWLLARHHTERGDYPLRTVLECPYVMRLVHDPRVVTVAESYLRCRATLSSIGIRWSFPNGAPSDVNALHRDPDDWRFVKVFVYLTDVDTDSGPHLYVLGSHRTRGRLFARPYAAEELDRHYPSDAFHQVIGKAGTSFIADTYGIHKGMIPSKRPRLMLMMQYSVLQNYALQYEPVALAAAPDSFDRYMMRLLIA